MNRNLFNEEHEIFRDSVRSFMQKEIAPNLDKWAKQGIVDREAFLKAGENGLLVKKRAEQARGWLWREVSESLLSELKAEARTAGLIAPLEAEVAAGRITPSGAARRLLQAFHAPEPAESYTKGHL